MSLLPSSKETHPDPSDRELLNGPCSSSQCQAQLQGSSWGQGYSIELPAWAPSGSSLWPPWHPTIPAGPGTAQRDLAATTDPALSWPRWSAQGLAGLFLSPFGGCLQRLCSPWEAGGPLWKGDVPRGTEFYIVSVVELCLTVPVSREVSQRQLHLPDKKLWRLHHPPVFWNFQWTTPVTWKWVAAFQPNPSSKSRTSSVTEMASSCSKNDTSVRILLAPITTYIA